MTDVETRARALLNGARSASAYRPSAWSMRDTRSNCAEVEAVCRLLEEANATAQRVSDIAESVTNMCINNKNGFTAERRGKSLERSRNGKTPGKTIFESVVNQLFARPRN